MVGEELPRQLRGTVAAFQESCADDEDEGSAGQTVPERCRYTFRAGRVHFRQ